MSVPFLALLLGLDSGASAASHTVETDGSGDFDSITDAIEGAQTGDTITVGPGTYSESIDFSGKNLTISSSDGAGDTTIDTAADATTITTSHRATHAATNLFPKSATYSTTKPGTNPTANTTNNSTTH